jgi:predicted Zn-dependent peptidase
MSRESLAARAEGAASQLLRLGEVWTTRDLVAAVDAVSAEAVAETARRALASAPAAAVVGPAAAQMEAHIFEPH